MDNTGKSHFYKKDRLIKHIFARIRKAKRKWFVPVIIGLICFVILELLSITNIFKLMEYKTFDFRMSLRNLPAFAKIQAPTHKRNPKITVVPIDDKTLADIDTPFFFWSPYFTKIFNKLIDNGATVIALDYQFQISPDEYVKGIITDVVDKYGKDKKLKIDSSDMEPYMPQNDLEMFEALKKRKVILMAYIKESGKVQLPYMPFLYAAGMENIGLVNCEPDEDGVIRRQYLYKSEDTGEGEERNYFALNLLTACKLLNTEPHFDWKEQSFTVGNISIPYDKKFSFYINYVAPAGTFMREHSFSTLLKKAEEGDNEFFKRNFAGKAVLLGPGYSGSTDLALTPLNAFTTYEMYGIEVHANALNTILNNDFIRKAPSWINIAILLFMALLTSIICFYMRPQKAVIFLLAAGLSLICSAFIILYHYNIWQEMAAPGSVIPLSFALVYSYRYITEDREKRYIRGILGRYISESVASEILKDPSNLALGGKRCEVSVLFCDINGFTTLSEIKPPEEVISTLNEYFTRMERVIFKHSGTLKQFVGDEIMVICGAPQPDPDHALRACTIGLAMIEELKKWQEENEKAGKTVFDVKFGIHSGEVVAGNVGSPHRTEYTTVGDVVNTASRIMGLTKSAGVRLLISEQTYEAVKEHFKIELKGSYPVKGRQKEVKVYELIAHI